jgi:hypothetical protein
VRTEVLPHQVLGFALVSFQAVEECSPTFDGQGGRQTAGVARPAYAQERTFNSNQDNSIGYAGVYRHEPRVTPLVVVGTSQNQESLLVVKDKCGAEWQMLIAWNRVQRPLALGGPGIPDLKHMGIALHLRWLWFQRSDPSKPWAKMPIHEDTATMALFHASIQVRHGNGKSILF